MFAAQYLVPAGVRPVIAAGLVLAAVCCLLLRGNARRRAVILALSAAAGFLWSWGHYRLFIAPGDALDGTSAVVSVTAAGYSENFDAYTRLYAYIDGENVPKVKTVVYDGNGVLPELSPGDSFTAELRFASASSRRGENIDDYTSRGIYLRAYVKSAEVDVERGRSVRFIPAYIAHYLTGRVDECFPGDTAPFFKALLLGDRKGFNADRELYIATSNSGLLHVVAISGMHLSFFLSFIRLFTGRLRRSAVIGIPLVILYALMTGGSASIIRAAVMQIFLLLAPLLKRENDPLTSLGAALLLLLAVNPAACASGSLQLSFGSILGIELLSERCYGSIMGTAAVKRLSEKKAGKAVCSFVVSNLSSSTGALAITTPLIALLFGRVSLYSVVSNLMALWIVSYIFCGGMVVLLVCCLWSAAGSALALVLSYPARYVFWVVRTVAGLPRSVIYTENGLGALWLVCVYVMFVITYVFRRKEGFRPVLPVCLSVISLCGLIILSGGRGKAAVLDVGQGLCSVISVGDTAVVIDCGSSFSGSGAGETCAGFLLSEGQRDVDLLCLTHLHADHCNGVEELFANMKVKMLALPGNAEDTDDRLGTILACCEKQGTQVVYIEDNSIFTCGDVRIDAHAFPGFEGENETGAVYLASIGEFDMLVTGDAGLGVENETAQAYDVERLELLVAGHHGSNTSSGGALLSAFMPDCAAVSVGAGNSYGHPAEETMKRLAAYCGSVYRTDVSGNIVFILG